MAGTIAGGQAAAKTNKEIHGEDFYKRIGSLGGLKPTTKLKGFAANRELARVAGAVGGHISKRGPKNNG